MPGFKMRKATTFPASFTQWFGEYSVTSSVTVTVAAAGVPAVAEVALAWEEAAEIP